MKCGVQFVGLPTNHVFAYAWRHFLIDHEDDESPRVNASPSCASAHLDEFARRQPPVVFAIKLPGAGEEDCSGGHVETHGEGLRGEERFNKSLAEENLDRLFENRQQTRVVNTDAPLQK